MFSWVDQWSKATSNFFKRDYDSLQHGELRSYCGSRFVKFSSGSDSLTSRTLSRQGSHCSTSSSSSFSSHTVSEIQTREREDRIESDISPVQVPNSYDDRSGQPDETTIERGNPLNSEIPEWLQEFMENLVDDEIQLHGDSHASSSHEVSLEPTAKRREDLGKTQCLHSFPSRSKLRDL